MILKNFVVLEGIDGAGTSTQLKILSKRKEHEHFFITTEPTPYPTGIFLRQMLKGDFPLQPETAAFLFAADRNEHIYANDGIIAQTKQNKIVISDRYTFSSMAYQSIGGKKELPYKLNEDFPLPEILFFFDVQPEVSLKRIQKRSVIEIYEKKDFLEKTAAAYNEVISYYEKLNTGMKIVRIDATESIEKTAQIIWSYLQELPILKA